MCLLVFAYNTHPDYPLVLVANRDEAYSRPTRTAHWWSDYPAIFAGRDLQGGGTWLGVTRQGRWAAVTNYREGPPGPASQSRGELVVDFLRGLATPEDFCTQVQTRGNNYNGFNLLAGNGNTLAYCSNRQAGVRLLTPGIYTLSNHLLDTPWPKSVLAREQLTTLLQGAFSMDALLSVLASRETFSEDQLPKTGVDMAVERALSAPFIVTDTYGTRCTTAIRVNQQGALHFLEQNFEAGEPAERVEAVLPELAA